MFQLQRSDALIEVYSPGAQMPESLRDKIIQRVIESLPDDLDLYLTEPVSVVVTVTPNGRGQKSPQPA